MSEPILKHQLFEYTEKRPFIIYTSYDVNIKDEVYLPHWHEELEIVCILECHSRHYVDGICYEAEKGRVLAIHSGSIHSIHVDEMPDDGTKKTAVILLVNKEFVQRYLPDYGEFMFANIKEKAEKELLDLMLRLSDFHENRADESCAHLYEVGLLFQILFYLNKEGWVKRENVIKVGSQKNIERMRGVLQYVETHYSEHISQAETAKRFYFNSDYFSRFFKQTMGMTFMEYLTGFRLKKAMEDLVNTDYSILNIAVKNGFSDGRAFSAAFRKRYGQLPLKYRKLYVER